jgi:hypothetical protein
MGLAFASGALADAKEQSVMHFITINAPPDVVWAMVGRFRRHSALVAGRGIESPRSTRPQ